MYNPGSMFLKALIKYVSFFVLFAVLAFGLFFWGTMRYVYSSGERAGYVQKFSKRGWMFKTWEGELAMVNLPGAMPEKFDFSVVNKGVPEKLQQTMGQRVVVKYEQHRYVPLPLFAETEYFVIDVLPVQDANAPASLPTTAVNK